MTLQELTEMEDEKLNLLCGPLLGWRPIVAGDGVTYFQPPWETDAYGADFPEWTNDLNACAEFESLLLSQPQPAKMAPGEPAGPLARYEFALLQLEPEKPLWAKSARTKTISFIYSQQK